MNSNLAYLSGSTSQYSLTPLASYTAFLCIRSFRAVLGDSTSTTRSGAPWTASRLLWYNKNSK